MYIVALHGFCVDTNDNVVRLPDLLSNSQSEEHMQLIFYSATSMSQD